MPQVFRRIRLEIGSGAPQQTHWYTRDMSRVNPGQEHFDPSPKGGVGPVPRDQLAEQLRGDEPDSFLDHIDPAPQLSDPTADERLPSSRQLENRRGVAK